MISVIIPTLNEEARIGALQKALARETVPNEAILVDGGSEDKTTNEAAAAGAVVLSASGGAARNWLPASMPPGAISSCSYMRTVDFQKAG